MTLFRIDIYRDHHILELLVQVDGDLEKAEKEVRRQYRGWKIQRSYRAYGIDGMIWKINEWDTD